MAFVVDSVTEDYQGQLLTHAAQAAADRGAILVAFVGGGLQADAEQNHVYQLLSRDSADAAVLATGTLANQAPAGTLESLVARLSPLPVVSIGAPLAGAASVEVDDAHGVEEVVRHLARVHERRHIAFIRGPRNNPEAERRFAAYQRALASCGLAYRDELVVDGLFRWNDGVLAVETLFDKRLLSRSELTGLVAANDYMALGACEELARRGFRIPEDVAVGAFDDVEEGRWVEPPLTTARQPLEQLSAEAVRLALGRLNGDVPEQLRLPSSPVFRRSCGCLPASGSLAEQLRTAALPLERVLVERRELIVAELARAARGGLSAAGAGWEQRLVSALLEDLRLPERAALLRATDGIVRRMLAADRDLRPLGDVLRVFRRQRRSAVSDTASERAEDALDAARTHVENTLERVQARGRMSAERGARELAATGAAFVSAAHLSGLRTLLNERLPRLGVPRAFLVAYEPGDMSRGRLLACVEPRSTPLDPAPFATNQLLPRALLPDAERAWLVESLDFAGQPLGYVVFELGAGQPHQLAALRQLLGAAVSRMLGS